MRGSYHACQVDAARVVDGRRPGSVAPILAGGSRSCALEPALQSRRAMQRHPVLVRQVLPRKQRTSWLSIIAGVIAFAIVCGVVVGPQVLRSFGESKTQIAQLTVNKYALEAYPMWRRDHPFELCPTQLIELNAHMYSRDTKDPWGEDYRMLCGDRGGIVVYSTGEDALLGTRDDVWSRP
jgi:hypothetical protein